MKTEVEKLEEMNKTLKLLISEVKRRDKLSEKSAGMNFQNSSPRNFQKIAADISWQAMAIDKLKHELHAICVDCDLAEPKKEYKEVEYRPSSFHHYKHKPRLPLCRQ